MARTSGGFHGSDPAAQRIDDKPRGVAQPRSSSLKRLSPDSTAFDSTSHPTTVFIVLLGGCWNELQEQKQLRSC
jgi:hypothetical protein